MMLDESIQIPHIYHIRVKFLDLIHLSSSEKSSDNLNDLVSVVDKYTLFSKHSYIMTDGAKCMTKKTPTGLVGFLRKTDVNAPFLHYSV